MSQPPRRTRVRQLADSVWPGRTVNGYANLIAARLRKLAEDRSTGMLPVSGHGEGAIFFRGGQVVYAESSRTPAAAHRAVGLAALGLAQVPGPAADEYSGGPASGHDGAPGQLAVRSLSRLLSALAVTEAVFDAVTDLLSSESRYAKLRPAQEPPALAHPIVVETLLTEVQRRHGVLRQLAAVVTPDTPVARQPSLSLPSAQVSAAQWALLVRVGDWTTPRGLAMHLGRSVLGTTVEVHRLVELGLLVATGGQAPGGEPGAVRSGPAVPFIRAVSPERSIDA